MGSAHEPRGVGPRHRGLMAVCIALALPAAGQDHTIAVVDAQVVDAPMAGLDTRPLSLHNNADGVADPGEWVGLRLRLRLSGDVAPTDRVRVTYGEPWRGQDADGGRFQIQRRSDGLYDLDASADDDRAWLDGSPGVVAATVHLGLERTLTTLARTSFDVPVRPGDRIPPVIWFLLVLDAQTRTALTGPVAVGQTVVFSALCLEAGAMASASGRILRLDGEPVGRVDLVEQPRSGPQSAIRPFEAAWRVDRPGTFRLEVTLVDEAGHTLTTTRDSRDVLEARLTTLPFEPGADVLYWGWPGSPFGDDDVLQILRRHGVAFDLWDVAVQGRDISIWQRYAAGQVVVTLPSLLGADALPGLAAFALQGGNLVIAAPFLFADGQLVDPDQGPAAILGDLLGSRLVANPGDAERLRLHAAEEEALFAGLDVVLTSPPASRLEPVVAGPSGPLWVPLLRDAAGGVQAVLVYDRGLTVYLNFDPFRVDDARVREELLLRSVEHLLGYPLPRAPVTAVAEAPAAPGRFRLEANSPNPFNATTTIRYRLRQAGHVRLTIFDLAGQQVARLVDQPQPAGAHAVRWSAGALASGVYLCRLRSGTDQDTRLLTLLK